MLTKFKKPKFYIPIGVAVLILISLPFIFSGDGVNPVIGVAQKTDIVLKTSVSGRVKSMSDVDLAFDRSGRVAYVYKDVGDRVRPGDTLVVLENGELAAESSQAQANIRAEQAKLDELKRGSTPEELNVAKADVAKYESAYSNAKKSAVDTLQDVQTVFDDAIRNKADQFFSNPRSSNPQLNIASDSIVKSEVEGRRVAIEGILLSWNVATATPEEMVPGSRLFSDAKSYLLQARSLLDRLSFAVNSLTPSSGITQTTIDGYKTSVLTARTNINNAIASITSSEDAVKSASSSLEISKSELALKLAPTRTETIAAQQAKVDAAYANSANLSAQIAKTYIHSPIEGIVTSRNVDVGEIVSANVTAISVISDQNFKIEANITESNIAPIKVNDSAELTLDAYPDVTFKAKVVAIDPAETLVDGVPTYKTTLHLLEKDPRIKSGMTANINILTTEIKDAIVVPFRAVVERGSDKVVYTKVGDEVFERIVTTGIRDGLGGIEVKTGIDAGANIVMPPSK